MRRAVVGWIGLTVVALAAAFWAGVRVGSPAVAPLPSATPALYTVSSGTVGSQISMPATVAWPHQAPVLAPVGGTVTSIAAAAGSELAAGEPVLTVDLRPLVVASGDVPAFRDLKPGVSGPDVTQLQQLLHKTTHRNVPISGKFDEATEAAVKAWQKGAGFPDDGVVRLGDVVFVAQLPARLALSDDVRVGSQIVAGQQLGALITGAPTFQINLTDNQESLVPQTGAVTVQGPKGASWPAVITSATADTKSGGLTLTLGPPQGSSSICGSQCAAIAVPGPLNLPATIQVVPPATGPVVPVGSLLTAPDGGTGVVLQDGTQVPVTVKASAKGLAVVSGIKVGARIQLLAADGG